MWNINVGIVKSRVWMIIQRSEYAGCVRIFSRDLIRCSAFERRVAPNELEEQWTSRAVSIQTCEACFNRSNITIVLDQSPSSVILAKVIDASRPQSSLCFTATAIATGISTTFMFRVRNPHFRLLYGFSDLSERGALTCIRPWRFASIYRDVPHSLLPRVRPMVMSLAGSEEFANCLRGFSVSTRCWGMEKWKKRRNNMFYHTYTRW